LREKISRTINVTGYRSNEIVVVLDSERDFDYPGHLRIPGQIHPVDTNRMKPGLEGI